MEIKKAYEASKRFELAVEKLMSMKKDGYVSDSDMTELLETYWIPKESPLAKVLIDYAFFGKYNPSKQLSSIVCRLTEKASKFTNHPYVFDVIPSNGFELPGDANLVLGQLVWYPQFDRKLNKICLNCGTVTGLHLDSKSEYYDIHINNGDYKEWYDVHYKSEGLVFLSKLELTKAIENNFIKYM